LFTTSDEDKCKILNYTFYETTANDPGLSREHCSDSDTSEDCRTIIIQTDTARIPDSKKPLFDYNFKILYTGKGTLQIDGQISILCSDQVVISPPDVPSNNKNTYELTLDEIIYEINEFITDDESCPINKYKIE
jgi:hypothetical protein